MSRNKLGGWACALLLLVASALPPAQAADVSEQSAALQLAAHIARASNTDDRNAKLALLTDYESVYGSIDKVPARWPALVRRALVCQQLANRVCVHSSMEALQKAGGVESLQLTHLFEVSRFGMTVEALKSRLNDAADEGDPAPPLNAKAKPLDNTKVAAKNTPTAPAPADESHVATVPLKPAVAASVDTVAGPSQAAASSAAASARPAKAPRTLMQRATARLGKLSSDEQSGYFLDALFIAIAVCLVLLLLLYSAARGRRAERVSRLQALQEIQRLEDLAGEEKIKTDHDLWSEQLKSEVALEAQKSHGEQKLRAVQAAADEALKAEMLRFKLEHEQAIRAFAAERARLNDMLKAEQLKTEDLVKAAKVRADQAIDAYDQMAARELVYAHNQNDALQDELKAEQQLRETIDNKLEEATQQIEVYKQREVRLQDAVHSEQRARALEARMASEKLKAAQQAAAALQTSLAATRALNADLELRLKQVPHATEAGAAESNLAQADARSSDPDAVQGDAPGLNQRNQSY